MLTGRIANVHFARLNENDDVMDLIKEVAMDRNIKAGIFMLIGTLKHVALGYYRKGEYTTIEKTGDFEIASCMGNVALGEKDETIIHGHIVVSNARAEAFGGHLFQGNRVGATAELVLIETEGVNLRRRFDRKTNLKLLQPT